jgi:hypothetical protein
MELASNSTGCQGENRVRTISLEKEIVKRRRATTTISPAPPTGIFNSAMARLLTRPWLMEPYSRFASARTGRIREVLQRSVKIRGHVEDGAPQRTQTPRCALWFTQCGDDFRYRLVILDDDNLIAKSQAMD